MNTQQLYILILYVHEFKKNNLKFCVNLFWNKNLFHVLKQTIIETGRA